MIKKGTMGMSLIRMKSWLIGFIFLFLGLGIGVLGTLTVTAIDIRTETTDQDDSLQNKPEREAKTVNNTTGIHSTDGRQLVESRSEAVTLKKLQALGYVDGTFDPDSEQSGVVLYKKEHTYDGYNFYSSRRSKEAVLLDMYGKQVYKWSYQTDDAWQHVTLLPNGDLIVIIKNKQMFRIDKNSTLLWSVKGQFHHDLDVQDGKIAVLIREKALTKYIHPSLQTLVDSIAFYSLDGKILKSISILDSLKRSSYAFLLPSISHVTQEMLEGPSNAPLDILHTNHVEIFDGTLEKKNPLYRKDNLLISIRNVNAIAILDGRSGNTQWLWGPSNLTYQHHPTLLKNGNILLFNNGVTQSQLIEISPQTNQIEWQYTSKDFFSAARGSNQRLPNGNTLVTESDSGYVFEITSSGETVWKFANPKVENEVREAIWRMTRVDPSALSFLRNRT